MRESKCEAVILAVMDYGEADRIVTFFTREHGKIKGIARGAKKSRKRFGGALEVFARLSLQIVLQEGLSRLHGVDVITIFPHVREDLSKIGYAGYACELVDRLLPEAQANTRLFRLLVSYLEHLDAAPCCEEDRRFFEVNLLNIIGYRPPLEYCTQCGVEFARGSGYPPFVAARWYMLRHLPAYRPGTFTAYVIPAWRGSPDRAIRRCTVPRNNA